MSSAQWRQTGGVWPLGISTSLTWYDFGAIAHILQTAGIRAVVEIGVEHGGLSAFLSSYCRYSGSCVYRGIDITLDPLNDAVREEDGHSIYRRDAWDPVTVAETREWLAANASPALIICDGGDKPRELRLYAPLLREGDIMIGHDYHNEYVDTDLVGMPETVEQVRTDWLDDTLLCMFVRRAR